MDKMQTKLKDKKENEFGSISNFSLKKILFEKQINQKINHKKHKI